MLGTDGTVDEVLVRKTTTQDQIRQTPQLRCRIGARGLHRARLVAHVCGNRQAGLQTQPGR